MQRLLALMQKGKRRILCLVLNGCKQWTKSAPILKQIPLITNSFDIPLFPMPAKLQIAVSQS